MLIASYIFGTLGIICTIVIYQQKSRHGLLISKLVSDVLWFLHYLFLGATAGAAIAAIGIVRETIFFIKDKKWAKSPVWLPIFLAVSILCAVFTWKDIFCLFTCIASLLSVISFFVGKPKLSRTLSFPISICMLTYDIANMSITGIINEALTLISSLVGYIRYDRKSGSRQ